LKQVQDMFKDTFHASKSMEFKAGPLQRTHAQIPKQSEVPTDMTCSSCQGFYEIYGIASKCPFCGNEDIKILDANLALIEKELNSDRALRQVYNDVVI